VTERPASADEGEAEAPGEFAMATLVDAYFKGLKILIAVFLAAMVVLVFGNVFLRYAFNSGIIVSEELSRWLFVWLVFLGAIVGMREHAHLGMDTFVRPMPASVKKACFILSQVLMLYATLLITKGSWDQTKINWDVTAPASGLSMAWFYGIGLVFGLSVTVILLHELWRALQGQLREDELVAIKESEEH
jgi:TRAP-type C4-dicarboxylate transport system permease small subunit